MKLTLPKKSHSVSHTPETVDNRPIPEPVHTDPHRAIRLGALVILIGFGGFLLWAILAPLDEGVPAPGVVAVESQRKTVQHLTGGIVESIAVKEGDEVKVGQILITLDPSQAQAQVGTLRAQYLSLRATGSRLLAEYANQPRIEFPEELLREKNDPKIAEIMAVQEKLFATRRQSQQEAMGVLRESAAALETQLKGMREMARDGYVPRNKMLDMERSYAEIRLRILQQEQDYRKQVEEQLSEVQKEVASLRDRLTAAEEDLERTKIRAPSDGIVVGLTAHTVGGVVAPGAHLMDIVPKGEPLIVETQVPPHLIDHVKAGMKADLRFVAFNRNKTPVIEGKVVTVSADVITDPSNHQSYYTARISVPQEEVRKLGGHVIQPGMPVEVIIKTGERTFMNYLIKPFLDRFAVSFKER